ncbi:hypothetical protein DH2020_017824 [Rehmannia glutinosa]|uniref:Scarecrow-like protein n=1 Tax=Rehmannia glutinosa TaxID=99300 RepID=A0ABR0WH68_REHGL
MGYPIENLVNGQRNQIISPFQEQSILGLHLLPNKPLGTYCDFSDGLLLNYINQMLMEEDMDEKTHMLQESLDFQAKEKSFYDAIGEKYPPSPQSESAFFSRNSESPDHNPYINPHTSSSSSSDGIIQGRNQDSTYNVDKLSHDTYNESRSVWNFKKGVEEASKFLPSGNNVSSYEGLITLEKKVEPELSPCKRNHRNLETDTEEERSSKLPALYTDIDTLVEEFDAILLNSMGEGRKKFGAYRTDLKNAMSQKKGASGKKGCNKKQNRKKEVIDLRTLLINCAQAVAADDCRNANVLIKQIRKHSSPCGDGNQRLAHYFADALEARSAGRGSQIYKSPVNKRTTAADYLKAYYTSLASAPFKKISNLATIQTIINKTKNATKIHIIDFGILYGFQWPTLIQRIAKREGGPPKVKITGIDFPQPGFRPAERVEDTCRRLARYAEKFNVPFEYNAIAQKWETIRIDGLKIEDDEFVAVTCLYRSKNLTDETVVAQSSRTVVLNLIQKINPDVFIHGVVNGTYSAPFFVTRFREVLYHFSALFDMLEANVPREIPERMLIEREIFAREAFNVIACEGWERVERPETYKQWQVRNMRSGFLQVPFDREIVKEAMEKVTTFFHKDFMIDEHSKWILLGWRGRIINAISCWKPV